MKTPEGKYKTYRKVLTLINFMGTLSECNVVTYCETKNIPLREERCYVRILDELTPKYWDLKYKVSEFNKVTKKDLKDLNYFYKIVSDLYIYLMSSEPPPDMYISEQIHDRFKELEHAKTL